MYYGSKHASEAAYDFYLKSNAASVICIEAYVHTQNYYITINLPLQTV